MWTAAPGCAGTPEPSHSPAFLNDTEPNVVRVDGLSGPICTQWYRCAGSYRRFLEMAEPYARRRSRAEVDQILRATESGDPPYFDPIPGGVLRLELIRALNIDFLLDGLDERELRVFVVNRRQARFYHDELLTLEDPWVGRFEALVLYPNIPGPHPAIVAAPGHGDTVFTFRDFFMGRRLAREGYVVVILTFRVYNADEYEDRLTREFLEHGFDLMSMRLYETELGLKLARSIESVDHSRIGLIGHSGGSTMGNVLVRIEPRFSAYVSDCDAPFVGNPDNPLVDDTVPALHPYHELISDFSLLKTPVLKVPYGYKGAEDDIVEFFDRNLKGPITFSMVQGPDVVEDGWTIQPASPTKK